jgi:hypothetical protein
VNQVDDVVASVIVPLLANNIRTAALNIVTDGLPPNISSEQALLNALIAYLKSRPGLSIAELNHADARKWFEGKGRWKGQDAPIPPATSPDTQDEDERFP